jgi:hypothetical protein
MNRDYDKFLEDFYIYGMGHIGTELIRYLSTRQIKPKAIIVSDGHRICDSYCGLKVCQISEIEPDKSPNILVAIAHATPIKSELSRLGFHMENVI